jgi:hypothetical protein
MGARSGLPCRHRNCCPLNKQMSGVPRRLGAPEFRIYPDALGFRTSYPVFGIGLTARSYRRAFAKRCQFYFPHMGLLKCNYKIIHCNIQQKEALGGTTLALPNRNTLFQQQYNEVELLYGESEILLSSALVFHY